MPIIPRHRSPQLRCRRAPHRPPRRLRRPRALAASGPAGPDPRARLAAHAGAARRRRRRAGAAGRRAAGRSHRPRRRQHGLDRDPVRRRRLVRRLPAAAARARDPGDAARLPGRQRRPDRLRRPSTARAGASTACWDYASGAPMATHFTFNAILRAHGAAAAGRRRQAAHPGLRGAGRAGRDRAALAQHRLACHRLARLSRARAMGACRPRFRDRSGRAPPRTARCTAFPSWPLPSSPWRPTWPAWRPTSSSWRRTASRIAATASAAQGEPLIEVPAVRRRAGRAPARRLDATRARAFYARAGCDLGQRGGARAASSEARRGAAGAVDGMGERLAPRGRQRCTPTAACTRRARTRASTASGATSTRRPSTPC